MAPVIAVLKLSTKDTDRINIDANKEKETDMGTTAFSGTVACENGYEVLQEKIRKLSMELRGCRNELCIHCGRYREAYKGACNHCRYKFGGDWEECLDEEA